MYVYLSSNCSKEYFPLNNSSEFTTLLPQKLDFKGKWEVALLQIQYPPSNSSAKYSKVNVHADFINDVIFEDNMNPILRRINISHKGKFLNINDPYYVSINKDHVDKMTIHIINDDGITHSFTKNPLKCTLHFRPCLT